MTEQGYPPRQPDHGRYGRPVTPQESRRGGWQTLDAFSPDDESESELPPWAGPVRPEPVRSPRRATRTAEPPRAFVPDFTDVPDDDADASTPARTGRRPGRSRAAATRRRRSRRRLVTWGSAAVAVVVITGVVYILAQPTPRPSPYVSHLQKGEFASVPDACRVMSAALLHQYLGGTPSKEVQTASGAQKSECTYQVDSKPTFRVLDITVQAYTPNLIAPGNGSATSYARYTFAQAKQILAKPPRHAPQPPATIKPIGGFGGKALSAVQVYRGSAVNDRATVLVQYRNVMVTVSLWATASRGFGPVSITQLQADAVGAARDVLAKVRAEPAVGA
ncbi:MAG TPA: hypothetical protein VFQ44_24645 [Streptosporangiaceae bacterium]|nr:hypothetical protein [Streptosporangiaceae bacterium]